MYILAPGSPERRSAQTVIFRVLHALTHVMAPILSFTSEEVWEQLSLEGKKPSIHMSDWPDIEKEMAGWKNDDLLRKWGEILWVRDGVMKSLELKREEKLIGSSLEARVCFYDENKGKEHEGYIKGNEELLAKVFKVSEVSLFSSPEEGMEEVAGISGLKISVKKAEGEKCARCWNYSDTVGQNKELPEICKRCYDVIMERSR